MEFGIIRNFINGEWEESKSREVHKIKNPALNEVIAELPWSTKEEVDRAVQAAKEAFPEWRRTTPPSRARYLFRLKELLEENFEDLAIVQTKEVGKTIDEARAETRRSIEAVDFTVGVPTLMMGDSLRDIASGIDEDIIREPLGVFASITPFNFPLFVPTMTLPFALATGNTFILKPSPEDPIVTVKLFEILEEAGFPPGVVNLVHGGPDVVNVLLDHPDIRGITFVGSTPVAKHIYRKCGETGKRVIANGGAKNFMLVMPDANPDQTVASLLSSFFGNAGQRCLAGSIVLMVGRDQAFISRIIDAFVEGASRIKVGYGLDERVQMGPLQSKEKKERVAGLIQKGVEEGAKLLLDGRKLKIEGDYPDTCFLGPTIFDEVTPAMTIGHTEIFGPVASIMRAEDLDKALDMVHSLPFGQGACIFTSSGKWAREFECRVQAGNVGINIGIAAPMAFYPLGGMKDSFFGTLHAQGKDCIRFFTESKIVIRRWF
jgi:malonate-semialdehyde dehydrogenase (acetylating)/methylmalonate-semialdehyde dehydrogenase